MQHLPEPVQLVPSSSHLGGICTPLTTCDTHQSVPISVCVWVPTSALLDLKGEACVPSAEALVHRFHLTWKRAGSALIHTNLVYRKAVNHHRTLAPCYQMGQKVYLSNRTYLFERSIKN